MEMISSTHTGNSSGAVLVEAMARYVDTGVVGPLVRNAEKLVGATSLRRVCISVLSWLKGRARLPRRQTMETDEAGSAEAVLVSLVQDDSFFLPCL